VTVGTDELTLVDAADAGDELCNLGALDAGVVAGNIVLCKRGAIGRVEKGEAVTIAGGAGMILYNANDGQAEMTDTHFVPAEQINNTDGVAVKAYIAGAGADATATITAGVFAPTQGSVMAGFSSRGPNPVSESIIKPDVTAPGVNILAGMTPVPEPGAVSGELFQAINGTSMSSPHVAGVFALIKQAHPDWSPAMAKSALMTTSRQDVFKGDGTTPADPFDMGAGHIAPGERVHKGSAFQPGLTYDAGFFDYLGFLCDADPSVFSNPAGTCGFIDSLGIATTVESLNYPSIGIESVPGSATVTRTVTSVADDNGWRTYTADVDAPDGYEVTVSPSSFRLKSGQSATFEVTVTNVSAAIGSWEYGSLTWNDKTGNYSVYSPIAVKASLFSAPDTIGETGEVGTTSFDVSFGYTGDYTAAGHGLEPATVTQDNVVQDPDQTFDPTDGYSNEHQFTRSGAAYFKVRIPPEAVANSDIDLDVFVYDPSGAQVATSTSGGTDETIEITNPADGTWSVFVHG
jgi:subtilisin family serine protease